MKRYMIIVDTDEIHEVIDYIDSHWYEVNLIQWEEINTEEEQLELDFGTSPSTMPSLLIE